MNIPKFHITVIVMLIWNCLFGQQFINYNISDGLPSNNIYRITQDNRGFIWVVTDKGMAKFNGKEFKTFTTRNGLPTNDIWDINVTPDNRVWYFSKSAVLGYIENDKVYRFEACEANNIMYPSSNIQVNELIALGQNNWFYFTEDCWREFTEIALDESRQVMTNNPLFDQGNNLSAKEKEESLGSILTTIRESRNNNRFYHVTRTKDTLCGMLYAEGYTLVNLKNGRVFDRKFQNKFSKNHPDFTRIHFVNNEIQVTGFNFVSTLDKDFEMKSVVRIPEALQSYFSMIDKSGNIWCATFTNGIYMLPQAKRNIKYDLESDKVNTIKKTGDLIIANVYDKGFYEYHFKDGKFRPYIVKHGFIFSADYIDTLQTHMFTTQQHIIGVTNGISRTLFSNSRLGLRKLIYFKGSLYGNNSDGLAKLDAESYEKIAHFKQVGITDLLVQADRILLSTSTGLKKFINDSITAENTVDEHLQYPMLNLAQLDAHRIVIGTDGFGAYVTDFKESQLLYGSEYLSIEDIHIEENSIWLATEQGILHYTRTAEGFRLNTIFDERDGLPSRKVNSVNIINDSIFASTDNGIAIFDKNKTRKHQLLDIFINKAIYNEQPILAENNSFQYKKKNNVYVEVSGIDFTEGKGNAPTYDYRLLPVQTDWIQTTSPAIDFTGLSPDQYQFQIKHGKDIKTMKFIITPLWWQRTGIQVLFLLCILALTGLVLIKIRKHELSKRMAKVLTEKKMAEFELYALRSQMNPHFVFNSLAAIQYYINNNEIEKSESYLVKFSRLIRQFFELSKESEISLQKEIELLENYLAIEKIRFKERLTYEFMIDPNIDVVHYHIPVMLLQPVVENAVNHGIFNKEEPGRITISFIKQTESAIRVEIADDGVGFDNNSKKDTSKVNSSKVIEERIYHLNRSGNWQIEWLVKPLSNEGDNRGTIVSFQILKIK